MSRENRSFLKDFLWIFGNISKNFEQPLQIVFRNRHASRISAAVYLAIWTECREKVTARFLREVSRDRFRDAVGLEIGAFKGQAIFIVED